MSLSASTWLPACTAHQPPIRSPAPSFQSRHTFSHTTPPQPTAPSSHAPATQVKWVDRGADREEVLVSISTDGRVTQWSTAKGLEHTDLMKLKRLARQAPAAGSAAVTGKLAASGTVASGLGTKTSKSAAAAAAAAAGEQDALVSRHSGGMSFDFSSRDHRIYLAGALRGRWWVLCARGMVPLPAAPGINTACPPRILHT